ncbi:hypothetical protein M3P05_20810, partial [Sansalvadorimonas sp. 2012CJ34-2]
AMPAKAKELLQVYLRWQAVVCSNVIRATPAQTLCYHGSPRLAISIGVCHVYILIVQQFNVFLL